MMSVQGRKADLETAPVFRVSSSEEKPDFEATIMPTKASRLSAIRTLVVIARRGGRRSVPRGMSMTGVYGGRRGPRILGH